MLLLAVMQRALLLQLLRFELADRLFLLHAWRRRLRAALVLLHAQLQLVLLLLALQLVALELARGWIVRHGRCAGEGHQETAENDGSLNGHASLDVHRREKCPAM